MNKRIKSENCISLFDFKPSTIKLDKKKVYQLYMQWVSKIVKECEWKSDFSPEEIVAAICKIIENQNVFIRDQDTKNEITSEELLKKYAYKHIPTGTWVYFLPGEKRNIIGLCLKKDATVSSDPQNLKKSLLKCSFNDIKNYCKNNFLEFKLEQI